MQSNNTSNWSNYYQATRHSPPTPLLLQALKHIPSRNRAIDIGAGALKDSHYLLDQGFHVTAIDQAPLFTQESQSITSPKFQSFTTSFTDFNFPLANYSLAIAMFSLPFCPPQHFHQVITNIKLSLIKDGIFAGQLFGTQDDWSNHSHMTFHTLDQVNRLFSDVQIVSLKEIQKNDLTVSQQLKHWHIFHFIIKRI